MGLSDLFSSVLSLRTLDVLCSGVGIYLTYRIVFKKRRASSTLPLPPGPRPLPIIGNLFDLPKGPEGKHWAKHKDLYGPISSVKAFGSTFILVNDWNIASDLLDKRSAISSDRPLYPFGGQMVGFDRWLTTFKQYNDEFKMHRRLFHNYIGTRFAVSRFEKLVEAETRRFLLRVLTDPSNLLDHIRALPGTVILKLSYGYTTDSGGSDPLVALADEVMADILSETCVFGNWMVDILPFVKDLPEWLPGMGFIGKARVWAKTVASLSDRPYEFVKHQMETGNASGSFIQECIEKGIFDEETELIVKSVAASIYGGGADTTVSAISTFYLAMILYPNVLKCAQEEMDRVVGTDHLPSFSDRKNLPYLEAIIQETLRWENVVPLNIPHMMMEDDTYMGYFIPKGSLIFANIWYLNHDPDVYPEPFTFDPERFLGKNGRAIEPDPKNSVFGFGRRICPGKELADNNLYLAIAMSVAVFNITKSKDASGNDIEPLHEYVGGVISHPKPFVCSVKPRSQKAESLILSVLDDFPLEKGDGEILQAI